MKDSINALLSLEGRVAIVTGAAKNIGKQIAVELARAGARVVIADIQTAAARKVAEQINSANGQALAIETDVSDAEQIQSLVSATVKEFGRVDILVNNAALLGPRTALEDLSLDQWDRMQQVNLRSAFLAAQAVVPQMKRRRKGKIINISSVVFWVGMMNTSDYSASKGGLIGLTRALARELGAYNINVNAITPGAVKTPEERKVARQEDVDRIVEAQCLKRRVLPHDIARAALFLASDLSDAITGQTLNVDGGWVMH
ncbi:MAG TPA: 3-oxoacyl-ACP reductase family protein [Pyrinomonadaceae bacterium]|nr:3-oxoacyl-ACP reductase family protein [Pyrinomonadaceae bacterium]